MVNNVSPDAVGNLLTLVSQASKAFSLKQGIIIKALVSAIHNDGNAVLRVLSGGGEQSIQGTLLKAKTQAPLIRGQTLFLEIVGGKSGLQMKVIGDGKTSEVNVQQKVNVQDLLTFVSQASRSVPIKPGTIIRALVAAINNEGDTLLKIISSGSSNKDIQGTLINTRTQAPLTKGQTVLLEIISGNARTQGNQEVLMKLIGESSDISEADRKKIPARIFSSLARLPHTTLTSREFKTLLTLIRSLPDGIKNLVPDFRGLEKMFVNSKELKGQVLHSFIESSQLKVPVKIFGLLSQVAGTRLSAPDIKSLLTLLNSLPDNIKTAVPEFANLQALLAGTKQVSGTQLNAVMHSPGQTNVPAKILNMMPALSDSRLTSTELQSFLTILKSIPESIIKSVPELKNLEAFFSGPDRIDGKTLKAFIESSGVALETKVRIAVLSDPGSVLHNMTTLQAGTDMKSLLLNLIKQLKEEGIISRLKLAGLRPEEISDAADKVIRHIEFFQFSSKINNMFGTFLPVMWEGVNDGELFFKKGRHNKKHSYTCDINLDIKALGKLSISITTLNKAYYITFNVDNKQTEMLLNSEKIQLEKRFASLGMPLKALSINHRKEISFGTMQQKEISMKA